MPGIPVSIGNHLASPSIAWLARHGIDNVVHAGLQSSFLA